MTVDRNISLNLNFFFKTSLVRFFLIIVIVFLKENGFETIEMISMITNWRLMISVIGCLCAVEDHIRYFCQLFHKK